MKTRVASTLIVLTLIGSIGAGRAATFTVTTTASTGAGSLAQAIHDANASADSTAVIAFNISGAGPHYIQVPPNGFPLITKSGLTIDGYSQPGASPNTASIHAANNAVLKIVLTATNGNALSMYTACTNAWGSDIPNLGYGDDEQAILGFFDATNVTVQGLVIQATPFTATTQGPANSPNNGPYCKSICFACNSMQNGGAMCQNFRVSGCWFGLDPVSKQVANCTDVLYGLGTLVASPAICIASYRTRNADVSNPNYNHPGTIGVAVASANPRAEFNVFVTGYGYDSEGFDYRFCGNFFGVLPDGVTSADMGVLSPLQQVDGYLEVGREANGLVIGTDGDGINDDQEGNVFGPMTVGGSCLNLYSAPRTNIVVAGNYFSVDVTGHPFAGANTNVNPLVDTLSTVSTFRFGSDFNGVSDDLEANKVVNTSLVKIDQPGAPSNASWVSMRGNSLLNTTSFGGGRPPIGDGQIESMNIYAGFIDINGQNGTLDIIPVIGAGTTATTLTGTCGLPAGAPYTNLFVDLYEADDTPGATPQGKRWIAGFQDNSKADSNPAVGAFTFSTAGLGITPGTKLTITVTYTKDTAPMVQSVSRAGSQTTLSVTNGVGPGPIVTYGIQKASSVNGSYAFTAAAVGGAATLTDNNPVSFYRATGPAATGQTSPFSDVFVVP